MIKKIYVKDFQYCTPNSKRLHLSVMFLAESIFSCLRKPVLRQPSLAQNAD